MFHHSKRPVPPRPLVLSDLAVTVVDPDADIVRGTAATGAVVHVLINDAGVGLEVTADATSGEWASDFSALHDIRIGTDGTAGTSDSDGNQTRVR